MKHTIKAAINSGVIVTDTWLGGDEIFLSIFGPGGTDQTYGVNLTDEQAAATIFALERAIEARQVARDRRISCAGDGLCSVPAACTTPVACGVSS